MRVVVTVWSRAGTLALGRQARVWPEDPERGTASPRGRRVALTEPRAVGACAPPGGTGPHVITEVAL